MEGILSRSALSSLDRSVYCSTREFHCGRRTNQHAWSLWLHCFSFVRTHHGSLKTMCSVTDWSSCRGIDTLRNVWMGRGLERTIRRCGMFYLCQWSLFGLALAWNWCWGAANLIQGSRLCAVRKATIGASHWLSRHCLTSSLSYGHGGEARGQRPPPTQRARLMAECV